MSAAPHAYDDLAEVYAEETSFKRLLGYHPVAASVGSDRCVNHRPSLSDYDNRSSDQVAFAAADIPETAKDLGHIRPTAESVTRAAHSGGAANKARWEKINAAKKALKEAA